MKISSSIKESIEIVHLENEHLQVNIVPSLGGKMISIFSKQLQKEFVWTNQDLDLQIFPIGTDYDTHFLGGVDELFPSDIPELVNNIPYPDHGELWTTPLYHQTENDVLTLRNTVPLSDLYYEKQIILDESAPFIHMDYIIRNDSNTTRNFLWKMHAALIIKEGDQVECFAKKGQVVDPDYSRFKSTEPFHWPTIENTNTAQIPAKNNTMDFYYIYELTKGEMSLIDANKTSKFSYFFDKQIFPFLWYFASYGGFLGHYTAILEPCTNMPISINEAIKLNQSASLEPGQEIRTRVSIYAGAII